jgi:hypothetical protein
MGIARHDGEANVHGVAVGMVLQTLPLGLTARGLGTCLQVSIAGYPWDTGRVQRRRVASNP